MYPTGSLLFEIIVECIYKYFLQDKLTILIIIIIALYIYILWKLNNNNNNYQVLVLIEYSFIQRKVSKPFEYITFWQSVSAHKRWHNQQDMQHQVYVHKNECEQCNDYIQLTTFQRYSLVVVFIKVPNSYWNCQHLFWFNFWLKYSMHFCGHACQFELGPSFEQPIPSLQILKEVTTVLELVFK